MRPQPGPTPRAGRLLAIGAGLALAAGTLLAGGTVAAAHGSADCPVELAGHGKPARWVVPFTQSSRGTVTAPASAAQGDTVTVGLGGHAGQRVKAWLFSSPRLLYVGKASAAGAISVRIPTGVKTGTHRLAVYDRAGDLIGWDEIEVTARPIINTEAPAVLGKALVGAKVKADPGQWSPREVATTYQWTLDGAPIAGATSASYRIAAADLGKALGVTVTASRRGAESVSASSPTVSVEPVMLVNRKAPRIAGKPFVGSAVKAKAGSWRPRHGLTLAYQWKLNGTDIAGATGKRYQIRPTDLDGTLTVAVTASAAGADPVTATSAGIVVTEQPALTPRGWHSDRDHRSDHRGPSRTDRGKHSKADSDRASARGDRGDKGRARAGDGDHDGGRDSGRGGRGRG